MIKKFKIKYLGEVRNCLGMRVTQDKKNGTITPDQESYINRLLKWFNITDTKIVSTPMEIGLNLSRENDICPQIPYQQLIGSLMYLSVLTRPDISYYVSNLSQFNDCDTETH